MGTPHTNIIPEVLVYNVLTGILKYIREDIESQALSSDTILYSILQDTGLLKHDYLREAIDLFSRKVDDPRSLEVRLFFNSQRAEAPTIHISLGSDEPGPINSIGMNEDEVGYTDTSNDEYASIYGRSFNTMFTAICTSHSHHEVLIMYHVLKASLISTFASFEHQGFQNISISGRDIQLREDLVPVPIFSRGIMIRGFYETRVRDFFNTEKLTDIIFQDRKSYSSS